MTKEKCIAITFEVIEHLEKKGLICYVSPKSDTTQPPERVWECPGHPTRDQDKCGLWPVGDNARAHNGQPETWHYDCWSAYQIKTLRGMVKSLRDATGARAGLEYDVWKQTGEKLAELYPERKDTP